ncbi:MAG: ChaN family lipoprotein [Gemmatimonadota bacterium]
MPGGIAARTYDAERREFIELARLADRLAAADVVLFGERHDDAATHRFQRALLEALGERRTAIVLSLEMFERDVQPALDAYLEGRITEAEFLARSRPWANYRTDYRPLVELASSRGWPVVAANVPRRIAATVADAGLAALDGLPAAERALAGGELRCPRDAYHRRFIDAMGAHPDADRDAEAPDRLYEAQCVRDETMAESIAGARTEHPSALVVHVTGAFHVEYGQGTAARLARRLPDARVRVVSAVPVADPEGADPAAYRERADYVVFTASPAIVDLPR